MSAFVCNPANSNKHAMVSNNRIEQEQSQFEMISHAKFGKQIVMFHAENVIVSVSYTFDFMQIFTLFRPCFYVMTIVVECAWKLVVECEINLCKTITDTAFRLHAADTQQ